ncbi:MAG TPA: glycosyltransferase [Phycisphaerales bacterium]|nr:glycosyltransferase [Phycisphaerales bacterium]
MSTNSHANRGAADTGAGVIDPVAPSVAGGPLPVALEIDPARPGKLRPIAPAAPPHTRVQVILPFYNEAGLIRHTFEEVEAFALAHPEYAFLFVDDGSSDDTADTLRLLISESDIPESRLRLISYAPNRGKGQAVKAGVEGATADLVLFTDGDLAYSMDHLPKLAAALEQADVVIGSRSLVHRSERNTTTMRRIMGWTFNKCARAILGLPYTDTQAGLKGFRLDAARAIFARQRLGGFAFDVELVYLAKRLGYRIGEIPAYVSEAHSYKVSKVNLIKDPLRMFGALVDVRCNAILGRYGRR